MSPALPNDHMQVLMHKLAMAGLELPVGPAYDPDAEAYFARVLAGSGTVISDAEKKNISNFIITEKSEGRWNYAIDYWTGRSSQNANIGTIVFGLKGTYDAEMISGPSWQSNGIRITPGTYISLIDSTYLLSEVYTGSIHSVVSVSDNNRTIHFQSNTTDEGGIWGPLSNSNAYWDCVTVVNRINALSSISDNQFNMVSASGLGLTIWVNENILTTGSSSSLPANIEFTGFGVTTNPVLSPIFNGTMSFSYLFNKNFNDAENSEFYQNYKTNLGQGLGLP